jgi:hypothetical protein
VVSSSSAALVVVTIAVEQVTEQRRTEPKMAITGNTSRTTMMAMAPGTM